MSILSTIIIGFIAGVIAKFVMPGDNVPSGFILTTILGIVGAFVASYLGEALGWYRPGEGAGLIGAIVGAIIVLFTACLQVDNGVRKTLCRIAVGDADTLNVVQEGLLLVLASTPIEFDASAAVVVQ